MTDKLNSTNTESGLPASARPVPGPSNKDFCNINESSINSFVGNLDPEGSARCLNDYNVPKGTDMKLTICKNGKKTLLYEGTISELVIDKCTAKSGRINGVSFIIFADGGFVDLTDDTTGSYCYFSVINHGNIDDGHVSIRRPDPNNTRERSSGSCFFGDCTVKTPSEFKKVKDLRKGDIISTDKGDCELLCSVKNAVPLGTALCKFDSGLLITKFHPIIKNGKWAFPNESKSAEEYIVTEKTDVYSLLFKDDSGVTAVEVNKIMCATIGHKFTNKEENRVIGHPFFGNHEMVVESLKKVDEIGFNTGIVTISGVSRGEDYLVNGYI